MLLPAGTGLHSVGPMAAAAPMVGAAQVAGLIR